MSSRLKREQSKQKKKKGQTEPEPPEKEWSPTLDVIVTAMVGSMLDEVQKQKIFADELAHVHFLGTSKTRQFFAEETTDLPGKKARSLVMRKLKEYLEIHVRKGFPGEEGVDIDVSFSVLSYKQEAEHEYNAARAALEYAIDIPESAIIEVDKFAALAWGNGSTQGYSRGRKQTPITAQIGLIRVKEYLDKFVADEQRDANERGDSSSEWTVKMDKYRNEKGEEDKCIVFADTKAASRAYTYVRRKIKQYFHDESLPIKVFETADDRVTD